MILIDTAPLVALCDARDSQHRRAMKELGTVASATLATCEAVLMDACFHLPHQSQRARLRALIEALEIRALRAADDGEFWSDVLNWLVKYGDHNPGWADGCIAVLCGRDETLKVWTYDREFRRTWRKPNGGTIPMAVKG